MGRVRRWRRRRRLGRVDIVINTDRENSPTPNPTGLLFRACRPTPIGNNDVITHKESRDDDDDAHTHTQLGKSIEKNP
jgi:hypothetical protein